MARTKDRQKALELRLKKEMSYSQIKKILGVSKSTLSYWLRDYPLSEERIRELRDKSEVRIEKFRETMRLKRVKRLKDFYPPSQKTTAHFWAVDECLFLLRWISTPPKEEKIPRHAKRGVELHIEEKRKRVPLSRKELFVAGLFLYWGEGVKSLSGQLSLNNTDPQVMKFYLYWLVEILGVPKNKIKGCIHLYGDMDVKKETLFWCDLLKINPNQLTKPYIKESTRSQIDHKGFGHGTCTLYVNDVRLKERVMMALKAIADYYSDKIGEI